MALFSKLLLLLGVRQGVKEQKAISSAAGLAQSAERLTAEREVADSARDRNWVPTFRVLKLLRNEDTAFALQMARPSRGSDDHVKWLSRL